MLPKHHTKVLIQWSDLRQLQIQVAVNILFYELTNPIREDPYVGFPIHKFLWSSNITYYNILKFGDDPTVGSSIHILIKYDIVMNLGSND